MRAEPPGGCRSKTCHERASEKRLSRLRKRNIHPSGYSLEITGEQEEEPQNKAHAEGRHSRIWFAGFAECQQLAEGAPLMRMPFAVFVDKRQVAEWVPEAGKKEKGRWVELAADAKISHSSLAEPMPVAAIVDAASDDDTVAEPSLPRGIR